MNVSPVWLVAAAVLFLLAGLSIWFWLSRGKYRGQLQELQTEVEEVAAHSGFGRRIEERLGEPEYNKLGTSINLLMLNGCIGPAAPALFCVSKQGRGSWTLRRKAVVP